MCMSRDYKSIPERSLIEDCALEHAISFDDLNKCATQDDGGFGVGMLRDSVRKSSEVTSLPQLSSPSYPTAQVLGNSRFFVCLTRGVMSSLGRSNQELYGAARQQHLLRT
jgi:hypothetical protein